MTHDDVSCFSLSLLICHCGSMGSITFSSKHARIINIAKTSVKPIKNYQHSDAPTSGTKRKEIMPWEFLEEAIRLHRSEPMCVGPIKRRNRGRRRKHDVRRPARWAKKPAAATLCSPHEVFTRPGKMPPPAAAAAFEDARDGAWRRTHEAGEDAAAGGGPGTHDGFSRGRCRVWVT